MRKIYLFAGLAMLAACNPGPDKTTTTDNAKTTDSVPPKEEQRMNYPYMADYSSDFEIGDSKNVQTVLALYKDWDNNTLDNSKNYFADVDTMYFSDGGMYAGGRDSLIAMAKKVRGQMGSVVDSVHAFVALRSKDKKEDWVAIWTREISTNAKGKRTAKELHEVWRFDKDGKINLVYQYEQQPPKMPPPPAKK